MLRLTREQVREIDRRAIEEFHIPGIVLMENAARAVVDVALEMLQGRPRPAVAIVCGGGNNGGDGLAVARHLHNAGFHVEVVNASTRPYSGDAAVNYRVARAMRLSEWSMYEAADDVINCDAVDMVVDSLFGTGLSRPPEEDHERLIRLMNGCGLPILAVDVPSGLDCNTGEPLGPSCVRAKRTVTFVAEKAGFANPESKQFTGEITVGDIGCPRELVDKVAKMWPP
jgi:NAD(P)H-hydrate epimerase